MITKLSDAPELEIESGGKVYKKYGNLLSRHYFEGKLTWSSIWQRLSFTNYVQYVLPEWQTEKEDLTERDLKAFHMALESTKAEIVIIWGCVVNKPIQALAIDRHTLQETSGYLFQIEYGGKTIPVVNPYHPASPHCFYRQSKENFFDALNKAMSGQPY